MKNHIAKEDLVHGKYYIGHCRNATKARWDAHDQKFYYWRQKFGDRWVDSLKCPEDDIRYDVFYAHTLESSPTEEIPLD